MSQTVHLKIGANGVSVALSEFLASDFAGRISLVASTLAPDATRPSSLELSTAWLQILDARLELNLSRQAVHTIAGEAIALQPEADFADRLLSILLDDDTNQGGVIAPEVGLFIVSCERYLSKALRLCDDLSEFHSSTFVVVGDPIAQEARLERQVLTVPSGDSYEDLPTKTMQMLIFARRVRRGAGIFKIDDDARVAGPPDRARMTELEKSVQYAGYINDPSGRQMDRCWHAGKCLNRDMTPYRGRYRNPYASGAAYYLGPGAVDVLVKDYFRYRAEFDAELYEDKAIGTILAINEIEPKPANIGDILGLQLDMHG